MENLYLTTNLSFYNDILNTSSTVIQWLNTDIPYGTRELGLYCNVTINFDVNIFIFEHIGKGGASEVIVMFTVPADRFKSSI